MFECCSCKKGALCWLHITAGYFCSLLPLSFQEEGRRNGSIHNALKWKSGLISLSKESNLPTENIIQLNAYKESRLFFSFFFLIVHHRKVHCLCKHSARCYAKTRTFVPDFAALAVDCSRFCTVRRQVDDTQLAPDASLCQTNFKGNRSQRSCSSYIFALYSLIWILCLL